MERQAAITRIPYGGAGRQVAKPSAAPVVAAVAPAETPEATQPAASKPRNAAIILDQIRKEFSDLRYEAVLLATEVINDTKATAVRRYGVEHADAGQLYMLATLAFQRLTAAPADNPMDDLLNSLVGSMALKQMQLALLSKLPACSAKQ